MKNRFLLYLFSFTYLIYGCDNSEDDPGVDCTTVNITTQASTVDANCGSTDGEITVTASGGTEPYEFKLGTGSFQSSGTFSGLEPGNYEVEVRDENGCGTTTTVMIQSGVSFQSEIEAIINTNCAVSGCHVSGTSRPDFTVFSNIQSRAGGIKSRTQAGTMPPASSGNSLSEEEIQKIACWVDDGAQNN